MARSKDEFLGCATCRTVLFRLRAVPGDNHSVFVIRPEALTEHQNQRKCSCGAPLERMPKGAWE